LELLKLLERVPIPIKESIEEPSAKVSNYLMLNLLHGSLYVLKSSVWLSDSLTTFLPRLITTLFNCALTLLSSQPDGPFEATRRITAL